MGDKMTGEWTRTKQFTHQTQQKQYADRTERSDKGTGNKIELVILVEWGTDLAWISRPVGQF